MPFRLVGLLGLLLLITISLGMAPRATAGAAGLPEITGEDVVRGPSGLPVPRFVALKRNEVRARFGPSFDYPVAYEFRREGLPLKVIQEDRDNVWRRVEDRDGRRMWIHRSMLTANAHAVVNNGDAVLRASPEREAPGRARLALGVMAKIEACEAGWCRLRAGEFRGWLPAEELWGAQL